MGAKTMAYVAVFLAFLVGFLMAFFAQNWIIKSVCKYLFHEQRRKDHDKFCNCPTVPAGGVITCPWLCDIIEREGKAEPSGTTKD